LGLGSCVIETSVLSKVERTTSERVYDYVVVGSGFGGSVSALRLVEKGYDVLLLEKGSELKAADFPVTNWNLKRWLWAPILGFRGFFQMRPFRHVVVLAGAGVGGGSLTYANTLPIPRKAFFDSPSWAKLADWERELAPHYETARRMLGAAPTNFLTSADAILKAVAEDRGLAHRFEKPHVGVFMGEPGKTVPDPYFGGDGPERTGCLRCGACMTGCRHGAKNTLDKNYLYLARRSGLELHADTEVVHVAPLPDGEYRIEARQGRSYFRRRRVTYRARRVVFAAGALGTNSLLLRLKRDPTALPNLSDQLGRKVRTNSESLIMVTTARTRNEDHSKGIAINSLFQADDHSHLEMTRYGSGSGFFRLVLAPHVAGAAPGLVKLLRLLSFLLLHPIRALRLFFVADHARATMTLLYMRSTEGTIRFALNALGFMVTKLEEGNAPRAASNEASDLALAIAKKAGGTAMSPLHETLLDVPTTAHILGGCCMGDSADTGVVDHEHRVFGYDGLYIVDGSAISANPGVNPSLTIAALAERAMGLIPPKKTAEPSITGCKYSRISWRPPP
jgi:cholesterol oxidase